jgi:hypothetical protein
MLWHRGALGALKMSKTAWLRALRKIQKPGTKADRRKQNTQDLSV